MDDTAIRRMVLPKLKMVYETNPNDLKIVLNILACLEIILHRLEKQQIVEDVLPLLWIINQTDPEVIARIAGKLRLIKWHIKSIILPGDQFKNSPNFLGQFLLLEKQFEYL